MPSSPINFVCCPESPDFSCRWHWGWERSRPDILVLKLSGSGNGIFISTVRPVYLQYFQFVLGWKRLGRVLNSWCFPCLYSGLARKTWKIPSTFPLPPLNTEREWETHQWEPGISWWSKYWTLESKDLIDEAGLTDQKAEMAEPVRQVPISLQG